MKMVSMLDWYESYGAILDEESAVTGFEDCIIMQYVGRIDNHGTEIYEGDVVLCESGESCQGYREYREKIVIDSILNWQTMQILYECEDVRVLGNIYLNPELDTTTKGLKSE